MIVPGSKGATAGSNERDDEVLVHTDRTRVFRRFLRGGTVVCKQLLGNDTARRVRHETAMLERLSSVPGVVKLSSATRTADTIVLEDLAGVPLSAMLSERVGIAPLLDLALNLTETIAAIHRVGIVHRDINPSNVLLAGPLRRPVLIDFGIASSFAEERPAFTAKAEIEGTLAYIAPEQTGRTGRALDQRADLYSLGVTLYELATGRRPFESSDPFQVIRDHLVRVPAPPSTLKPGVPQMLSDIIMRLLQKEPDRRYQSAEGLAADLTRLIACRAAGTTPAFPLGERDFPRRLLPPSRLIGREAEIVALHAAFEDAVAGRNNCILVAGSPGVGKTALINELRAVVTAKGGLFVTGKFDRYRQDMESDAVLQAFRSLFRLLLAEPEEELVPLRASLLHALGAGARRSAALIPELAALLNIAPNDPNDPPDDAPADQGRLTQTALAMLKCVASNRRPVIFVADDLQWAPATPLGLFDAVMSDGGSAGLLLVGAYRKEEVDSTHPLSALLSRWERLSSPPRRLLLNNLPADDLGDLLQDMLRLGPSQAARLADAVVSRTGGNPYDTVELINALRRDAALTLGVDGWTWDEATIRRYVGQGDVVDLLSARIAALPADCAALLETMACLGGDVQCTLLEAAGGFSSQTLEERLAPALHDGLAVLEQGTHMAVRFRHDRVQQAAYTRLEPQARLQVHLALARRLAAFPAYTNVAAEQYLPAVESVHDADERRAVIALFRSAAARSLLLANHSAVERFLTAARALIGFTTAKSDGLVASIETELHAALYCLGRLEDADVIYRSIAGRGGAALELVDSACVQISSLTNRNLLHEALTIGLALLNRFGLVLPDRAELPATIERRLDEIYRWSDDEGSQAADLLRPPTIRPDVIAAAKLINRMMPPAFFCDQTVLAWLVLESLRHWSESGPCAPLVGPISHAGFVTIALRGDYRTGYRVAKHVLRTSEARGYEPETSQSRFLFSLSVGHWFEPLEDIVLQAHAAHEGLVRGGDLQNACHTCYPSIPLVLECSLTIEELALEVEAALAFCVRTGNDQTADAFLPYRQLVKSLRGETHADGSFTDAFFDERKHLTGLHENPTGAVYFHITRALTAMLFGQVPELLEHIDAAMPLLPRITATPSTAVAHLLRGCAVAQRVRAAASDARAVLLAELDVSLDWLRRRAADAPDNFFYSVRLVEAERSWALADFANASAAFESALREVQSRKSPRDRALVAERAGLFYLEHGLARYGRLLLIDALRFYDEWGATAKARQLVADHSFLLDAEPAPARAATLTTAMSSEAIDMVGILRASQALSSQTNLQSLQARVVELLAALTGATAVMLVVRRDDPQEWVFSPPGEQDAVPISVKEAGSRGLLPLTAFRYVERTHEPLLLPDVTRDDRFARDPYFAGCEQCSMLVVPILSQGEPRAVLLLENRLGRDAFSTGRLDAVLLIAGQLAVTLDNALLYASLEQKVAERTEALAVANAQLARLSLTDALTGLLNRRGFDNELDAEWRRAQRTQTPIGFAMIDIDEFKKYNDRYGHLTGDRCLRQVATTIVDGLRPGSDLAARYGGEEFVLILPATDTIGTYAVAERLRANVAALCEPHATSVHGIVTVSVGIIAVTPSLGESTLPYINAADVALYEAKRSGRNRVAQAAQTPAT